MPILTKRFYGTGWVYGRWGCGPWRCLVKRHINLIRHYCIFWAILLQSRVILIIWLLSETAPSNKNENAMCSFSWHHGRFQLLTVWLESSALSAHFCNLQCTKGIHVNSIEETKSLPNWECWKGETCLLTSFMYRRSPVHPIQGWFPILNPLSDLCIVTHDPVTLSTAIDVNTWDCW